MTHEDYGDIERYRKLLVGKKIETVELYPKADEGLILTFDDNTKLKFSFSGCEGYIEFE